MFEDSRIRAFQVLDVKLISNQVNMIFLTLWDEIYPVKLCRKSAKVKNRSGDGVSYESAVTITKIGNCINCIINHRKKQRKRNVDMKVLLLNCGGYFMMGEGLTRPININYLVYH